MDRKKFIASLSLASTAHISSASGHKYMNRDRRDRLQPHRARFQSSLLPHTLLLHPRGLRDDRRSGGDAHLR